LPSFHLHEVLQQVVPYLVDILGGPDLVTAPEKPSTRPSIQPMAGGGARADGTWLIAHAEDTDSTTREVRLERQNLHFSELEERLADHVFKSLSALLRQPHDGYSVHHRAALVGSVLDIAVARLLRGHPRRCAYLHNVLRVMKELTLRTYEGHPCTSGFIFVSRPYRGWLDSLAPAGFALLRLSASIRVTSRFFESPLTYRYVDGKRAAYVVQSPSSCVGILRLDGNATVTAEDIAMHEHFRRALLPTDHRSFALFVNDNSEMDVLASDSILRWRRGQWRLFEPRRLQDTFRTYLDSEAASALLAAITLRLSYSRIGTLILLRDRTASEVPVLRHIDESVIAQSLRNHLLGVSLEVAHRSGLLDAALTSDGLTIVSPGGLLEDSGALVVLSNSRSATGGGRTAAAESASRFGLIIKVSEDGPIQLWQRERLVLQYG
jgi:hypothetical protein